MGGSEPFDMAFSFDLEIGARIALRIGRAAISLRCRR
jgi:hypothetical protein